MPWVRLPRIRLTGVRLPWIRLARIGLPWIRLWIALRRIAGGITLRCIARRIAHRLLRIARGIALWRIPWRVAHRLLWIARITLRRIARRRSHIARSITGQWLRGTRWQRTLRGRGSGTRRRGRGLVFHVWKSLGQSANFDVRCLHTPRRAAMLPKSSTPHKLKHSL